MGKIKIEGDMRLGNKGTRIKGLQVLLKGYGYDCGATDGWFGPKVHEKTKAYQKAQGLTVDGIVGPKTWGRLVKLTAGYVFTKASEIPKFTTLAISRTVKLNTKKGVKTFKMWAQSKSSLEYVRGSGCALSATLAACYPFAKGVANPTDFHKRLEKRICGRSDGKSGTPLAPNGAVCILKHYGLAGSWKPHKIKQGDITAHLKGGQPVIIWLYDTTGKYTSYIHTVLLAGVTDGGKWIMLDSGARKLDGRYTVKICDPEDVYKHIRWSDTPDYSYYWKGLSRTTGVVLVTV